MIEQGPLIGTIMFLSLIPIEIVITVIFGIQLRKRL